MPGMLQTVSGRRARKWRERKGNPNPACRSAPPTDARLSGSLSTPCLVGPLPDDYPKNPRTIRRDLETLEPKGFPLTMERVDGQTRRRFAERDQVDAPMLK